MQELTSISTFSSFLLVNSETLYLNLHFHLPTTWTHLREEYQDTCNLIWSPFFNHSFFCREPAIEVGFFFITFLLPFSNSIKKGRSEEIFSKYKAMIRKLRPKTWKLPSENDINSHENHSRVRTYSLSATEFQQPYTLPPNMLTVWWALCQCLSAVLLQYWVLLHW